MRELAKWNTLPVEQKMLIFASKAGTPIKKENLVRRYFEPALKEAELPVIRFQDLRHIYIKPFN